MRGGKSGLPSPYALVRELDSTVQHHLREVTQAQFVSNSPANDEEDQVSEIFQKIEGAAAPLIEASAAMFTLKSSIAQSSPPFPESCTWRVALGTIIIFILSLRRRVYHPRRLNNEF